MVAFGRLERRAAAAQPARSGAAMSVLDRIRRALVIAPHHDDEVLGCGGTIARLSAAGRAVHVAIVTRGAAPRFDSRLADAVRAEALSAHELLSVARTHFLDFPAAELDRVPQADLNEALEAVVAEAAPDTVFMPFAGDLHRDHQLVFAAALVACRPGARRFPARLLAYETLSETNWNGPYVTPGFAPNVFVDIAPTLERKLEAMRLYRSQLREPPSERSLAALRSLAILRGGAAHLFAAEAFVLLREVG
jgi:LmbE family N-acetylglucosaminyl deacetylase